MYQRPEQIKKELQKEVQKVDALFEVVAICLPELVYQVAQLAEAVSSLPDPPDLEKLEAVAQTIADHIEIKGDSIREGIDCLEVNR